MIGICFLDLDANHRNPSPSAACEPAVNSSIARRTKKRADQNRRREGQPNPVWRGPAIRHGSPRASRRRARAREADPIRRVRTTPDRL